TADRIALLLREREHGPRQNQTGGCRKQPSTVARRITARHAPGASSADPRCAALPARLFPGLGVGSRRCSRTTKPGPFLRGPSIAPSCAAAGSRLSHLARASSRRWLPSWLLN